MSFDNFFRNFWGSHEPSNRPDDMFDDEENRSPNYHEDPFRSFHAQSEEMRRHFEQHVNDIFKSFGFMDFGGPTERFEGEIPSLQPPPSDLPLRDRLLKEPDSERQNMIVPRGEPHFEKPRGWFHNWFGRSTREDRDLDSDVTSQGIDSLLRQAPGLEHSEPRSSSFFSSSSVTIRSGDGKIEQRFSKRDSQGNEETIVKRQLGDKSHSIKVRKDSSGIKEEEENFENTENLKEFNNEWEENQPRYLPPASRLDQPPVADPSAEGMYQRLFKNFLPKPKD